MNDPTHPIDRTLPGPRWEFDAGVTRVFDDMLARSIPQYDVMRKAVFDVAAPCVQPGTSVIDIGCSRGEAMAPFVERFGSANEYIGIERSESMALAARARFAGNERVIIRQDDLRERRPPERSSVVLSVLTLQFTPIEYRQDILRDLYTGLVPGGALVLVEKVLGAGAELNGRMTGIYYALKGANGYSPDAIERKRLSLEGVLVPVTARWNEDLLHEAGFRQVDCFWRWFNFAGWVAVKDRAAV